MRHAPISLAIAALSAAATAQQLQWTRAHALPPRHDAAIAYDSARQRLVLFGGYAEHRALADTWEWDGSTWIHRLPATIPPARFGHAMAFDSARNRVVLFGGYDSPTRFSDTWEWNGSDWTQVAPAVAPPGRSQHCMAFDELRQQTVLFGGFTSAGRVGDTWEWDGVTWTQRLPVASPAARSDARMAYDSARFRCVLYGGYIGSSTWPRDTWEWDGTNWQQAVTPVTPNSDYTGSLAFDATRGRTVLYGGIRQTPFARLDETWEWDGVAWQQQTPAASPPGMGPSLLAFDSAQGRTVVCGTRDLSSVWEWDGTAWTNDAPDQTPIVSVPTLMRDELHSSLLAFGTGSGNAFQTWRWSNRRWQQLQPASSPSLTNAGAAVDPLRMRIVVFGGQVQTPTGSTLSNETWEWDGFNWLQMSPATSPTPRWGQRMAYDHATNRVLLFGGRTSLTGAGTPTSTWAWDGTTWTQLAPVANPPGRWYAGMTADAARQRIVLFGGFSLNAQNQSVSRDDTWEWDGANWTQVFAIGPSPRGGASMDYDPARQRTVLFGGSGPSGSVPGETWEWDGTVWVQHTVPGAPMSRSHAALAYDAQAGNHVLLGGLNCVGSCDYVYDTWVLSTQPQPAVSAFGIGCGGMLGAPVHLGDEPWLGSDGFSLEVQNTPPGAPCLFGLSASQQAVPLGSSCTLYLGFTMDSWFTFANGDGVARVQLPIPVNLAFLGVNVFTQAAVWDVTGPFNGLSLSAARQLTIGI